MVIFLFSFDKINVLFPTVLGKTEVPKGFLGLTRRLMCNIFTCPNYVYRERDGEGKKDREGEREIDR
jgi:hypothetical protein